MTFTIHPKLDPVEDYWREAVMDALEAAGADIAAITSEQFDSIARSLRIAGECRGMAFGHDCIPNPLRTEIAELERKLKTERKAAEDAEEVWREAMAVGCRVSKKDLYRDGEQIKVWGY